MPPILIALAVTTVIVSAGLTWVFYRADKAD